MEILIIYIHLFTQEITYSRIDSYKIIHEYIISRIRIFLIVFG